MDFKTRFQGKTSMITKDGGIDNAIAITNAPINKIDMASISNSNFNSRPSGLGESQTQLITYGNQSDSQGFANGYTSQTSNFGLNGVGSSYQQKQNMNQSQFNSNPLLMNNTATSNHSYFSKANAPPAAVTGRTAISSNAQQQTINNNPYDYIPSSAQNGIAGGMGFGFSP